MLFRSELEPMGSHNPVRVVVTGLGAVSGLGIGAGVQLDKALKGQSGIAPLPAELASKVATRVGAQVLNFPLDRLDRNDLSMFDRIAHMSWAAANEALAAAKILPTEVIIPERAGIFWGVGLGGPATIERGYRDIFLDGKDRVRPFSVIGIMTNGSAALLSIKSGFKGPSLTYSTA